MGLRDKRGITLIEVLISLAILGILVILFSTVMATAINMKRVVFKEAATSMQLMKDIANVENGTLMQEKQITIQFEGAKQLQITGDLISKEEDEVSYHLFVPY